MLVWVTKTVVVGGTSVETLVWFTKTVVVVRTLTVRVMLLVEKMVVVIGTSRSRYTVERTLWVSVMLRSSVVVAVL
jgi:hypothetical protein